MENTENKPPRISFVIPVYNEEKNIPLLYRSLCNVFKKIPYYEKEIIFINDGSQDGSWEKIEKLARKDDRVKGFSFTRNFGHQMALTAGYDAAQGDVIISMDADMQDPPLTVLKMIKKWEEGFEIVYARRRNRNDGFLKRMTAGFYYKILSHVSEVNIPRNVGDFRLIDRRVLEELKNCREKYRYFCLFVLLSWSERESGFICLDPYVYFHGGLADGGF